MDIKNIYDVAVPNITKIEKTANFSPEQAEKTSITKVSKSSKDTAVFSAEASFKSKLNEISKTYASSSKEVTSISEARMNTLKQAYSGDNCPISSYNIATSMVQSVCGYNI